MEDREKQSKTSEESAQRKDDRRDFLIKAGKLVTYTAPAVIALLCDDKKALAACVTGTLA